ncbi:histidinol phosphatase [Maribacter sp. PR1]|nr:CpsB/CapC family capsule biosynthesis tyrosine phosphatase [Maribacter sp. PR1]MDC6389755.1 histidinol phosphatase [Maribacter sp. PR1]
MFNFFTKKNYLVDYLEGFVDIHNHILPGIDDGAKTVEDSLALIKGFGEFGVNDFVCTPHIMENYYPNTPTTISKSLSLLKNELKMQGMNEINISAAAEHMIDANFETKLKESLIMPLANKYLLIEMSFLQASINFDTSIGKIKSVGLFPTLAHPERYLFMHRKMSSYEKLKKDGILLQLNLLSLGSYYGKDVQKIAHYLIGKNYINLLGSDIHNLEQLMELKKVTLNRKNIQKIKEILNENKKFKNS